VTASISALVRWGLVTIKVIAAWRWWLTPVILATQEAEIRRIKVQSQHQQIVCKPLSRKPLHEYRAGGVGQGESPEFKPQYQTHTKSHCCLAGGWSWGGTTKETKKQLLHLVH
jgi:hypothetical protein